MLHCQAKIPAYTYNGRCFFTMNWREYRHFSWPATTILNLDGFNLNICCKTFIPLSLLKFSMPWTMVVYLLFVPFVIAFVIAFVNLLGFCCPKLCWRFESNPSSALCQAEHTIEAFTRDSQLAGIDNVLCISSAFKIWSMSYNHKPINNYNLWFIIACIIIYKSRHIILHFVGKLNCSYLTVFLSLK